MRKISQVFLAISLVSAALPGFAQLNSNQSTVVLTATLVEALTISASPATVTFSLVSGGVANASSPVTITSAWILGQGRAAISLDAYFASATAALSGGIPVVNIPSSEVYGLMATGTPTSYTAFTQNTALGTAGAGLLLYSQTLTGSTRTSNRSDNLNLQINLASQTQLPAGVYTGALILQAQAL